MPDQDTSNSSEGVQLDFSNEGMIGENDRELFDDENSDYDEDVDILSEYEVVSEDVEKLEDELFCPLFDGATIHDFRVNSHATPPRNKPHPWLAKRSRWWLAV